MPTVTYAVAHVVVIEIEGEPRPSRPSTVYEGIDLGPLPMTPDDGGLVGRLMNFMADEGIFSASPGGVFGGGRMRGYYTPADAEKIVVWLKEHGCQEDHGG